MTFLPPNPQCQCQLSRTERNSSQTAKTQPFMTYRVIPVGDGRQTSFMQPVRQCNPMRYCRPQQFNCNKLPIMLFCDVLSKYFFFTFITVYEYLDWKMTSNQMFGHCWHKTFHHPNTFSGAKTTLM